MRFVYSPIPPSETFDPTAKNWTPLDGADAKRFATIAWVLAVPLVAAALWLFLGFRSEVRGFFQEHPLHFAAFLSLLAALIPIHEFIHALAYFKGVSSPRPISDHEHDAIPFAECPARRLPSLARTPDADCIQRAQGSKDRDTVRLSSKHVPDIAAPFPASHATPQMPAIRPMKPRSLFLAGMAIAILSLATGWLAAEEARALTFVNGVAPILTKASCNSGACQAAVAIHASHGPIRWRL